jgi:cation/acetate symporter
VPAALAADKAAAAKKVEDLKAARPVAEMQAAEKALAALPADEGGQGRLDQGQGGSNAAAPSRWAACHAMRRSSRVTPMATPRRRRPSTKSRRNFLALVFCLMVGTAALPHILMRYYTTPSVKEARESVTWSLFFIFLLYFTAPALAVLVKYEVFNVLVGTPFDKLPSWISSTGPGRPGAAVGGRHQQGRHLPAG